MSSHKTVSNKSSNKSNRPRKSRKRWAAYASAASAALVSTQSGTVEGAIVDIAPASFGLGTLAFDLDDGGGNDGLFTLNIYGLSQSARLSFGYGGAQIPISSSFPGGIIVQQTVALGTRPSTLSSFNNTGFPTNSTKTLGLTLAGGNNAWIQVRLNTGPLNEFTGWDILNGAYEDSGAPIHVGTNAIPEPSTLALLGLAAAGGVASLRRHRKRQTV